MGLDMYLKGSRRLHSYFSGGADQAIARQIQDLFPELAGHTDQWGDGPVVRSVGVEVGYWRKANAIHNWFVREVQGGVDDCGTYSVSREQLAELKSLCLRVQANHGLAAELLPTASGFFFGSTSYDEGYYQHCIDSTIVIIDRCLALPLQWDFEYHSSW